MIKVLIPLFFIGFILGLILKRLNFRFSFSSLVSFIIYVLLFSLGLSMGSDQDLLSNLSSLGLTSLFLSVGSMFGCLITAILLEGKKENKEKKNTINTSLWNSLKGSIYILFCFLSGVFISITLHISDYISVEEICRYILFVLMFFVGAQMGKTENVFQKLRNQPKRYWFLPLCTILGSLAGAFIVSLFLKESPIWESLSVGSGLAYYSLSSIMIVTKFGVEWAAIALLSNIIRELTALIAAPYIAKISRLGLISIGGATSMDTTLPVISKYCGQEYIPLSMYHGFISDLSVPVLVSLFMSLA